MTAQPAIADAHDESFLVVVKALLLIQGAIGIASLLESLLASAAQGLIIFSTVGLTGAGGILTLWLAGRIERHGPRVRRTVIRLQYLWLAGATIDLLLSLVMTQRLLEPVALLTRVVIPIALIRMLRNPTARLLFNVPPSRRARRKARKLAEAPT